MDKKFEFNQALASLVELASVQNNKLKLTQIQDTFKDIIDNKDMYEHIYEYLVANKISIEHYQAPLNNEFSSNVTNDVVKEDPMEINFVNMYLEELDAIVPAGPDEERLLIEEYLSGDTGASERLIELKLQYVLDLAKNYKGNGVGMGDLIQEGNLGLVQGIKTYSGDSDFTSHIRESICQSLENAIAEQTGSERIANHLADRANALSDASTTLAEKLGREATIEELCEYMSLSEEEVKNIMKISLDVLNSEAPEAPNLKPSHNEPKL